MCPQFCSLRHAEQRASEVCLYLIGKGKICQQSYQASYDQDDTIINMCNTLGCDYDCNYICLHVCETGACSPLIGPLPEAGPMPALLTRMSTFLYLSRTSFANLRTLSDLERSTPKVSHGGALCFVASCSLQSSAQMCWWTRDLEGTGHCMLTY